MIYVVKVGSNLKPLTVKPLKTKTRIDEDYKTICRKFVIPPAESSPSVPKKIKTSSVRMITRFVFIKYLESGI